MIALLQLLVLLALFLAGEVAGLGLWYRISLVCSALFMLYQYALLRDRKPADCFRAFLNNRYIGATVFAGIVLSYTFDI